jgi:hypothetical protein
MEITSLDFFAGTLPQINADDTDQIRSMPPASISGAGFLEEE